MGGRGDCVTQTPELYIEVLLFGFFFNVGMRLFHDQIT